MRKQYSQIKRQVLYRMTNISAIKLVLILIACVALRFDTFAQGDTNFYWLEFTDKDGTPYSIDRPEEFLSALAISRRQQQLIPIIDQDLPVNPIYVNKLNDLDLEVISISKWFNGVIISSANHTLIENLDVLPFVASPPVLIKPGIGEKSTGYTNLDKYPEKEFINNYGLASVQLEMLNSVPLHSNGFNGQDVFIAILDAGFTNSDRISSLQHIWLDQRVLAIRDFVKDGKDIFNSHAHGTIIFSIIGGIEDQSFYGSAPLANYALVRTEDASTEYIIEEYNWIVGAEFADSLGVDIITSSLGYSLFDDPLQNHSYAEMDGKTTPITRAAEIAASKGIFIVSSAGNSGQNAWGKITAPADGETVMAVAAVDSAELIVGFSSRGPSYDQRIKPDVSAMGYKTIAQLPSGQFYYCSGTSCSAPLISGMAACLWQAFPKVTSKEILDAIRKSGSRYLMPDTAYGYGVPDFMSASLILEENENPEESDGTKLNAFPNPFSNYLYIEISIQEESLPKSCYIEFFDLFGRLILQDELIIENDYLIYKTEKLAFLPGGMYTIRYRTGSEIQNFSITKIQSNQ